MVGILNCGWEVLTTSPESRVTCPIPLGWQYATAGARRPTRLTIVAFIIEGVSASNMLPALLRNSTNFHKPTRKSPISPAFKPLDALWHKVKRCCAEGSGRVLLEELNNLFAGNGYGDDRLTHCA